jgi:hypothetical protein|tara:strand:+ start:360 stop:470 length:111 start_codon:yes stop_codon:yes gene_type:complete
VSQVKSAKLQELFNDIFNFDRLELGVKKGLSAGREY